MSPDTRFVALEANATYRPSTLMAGCALAPLPWAPVLDTLIRVVAPVNRSFTKMSLAPLVSPETRLLALDWKATRRPSSEIEGSTEVPFGRPTPLGLLTSSVRSLALSRTYTWLVLTPGTRFVAEEEKAMTLPSRLTAGLALGPLACWPPDPTLTRVVVGAAWAVPAQPRPAAAWAAIRAATVSRLVVRRAVRLRFVFTVSPCEMRGRGRPTGCVVTPSA